MTVVWCRTAEQVQQEEVLVAELKKIEMRKKERERKQQDLQKLLSAAEHNTDRYILYSIVLWSVANFSMYCRKGNVKKSGGGVSKKLKSGSSGHTKVSILQCL